MSQFLNKNMYVTAAILFLTVTMSRGDERHWAYQPVARSAVPNVEQQKSCINPIDRFIAQRLDRAGSQGALEADRATLIRRVSLDIIGLPPTPEEVLAFVDDDRPGAYERLVDRLLASPHYGEHWASPWLDLCHYADSDGYLTDQARPVAWRYRAWLVEALNEGMPFDQFTIEQLAGDLLPNANMNQKLATGFLRQTLSNREGGADPEEFRVKQVIDRTSMIGEIWMGLTVGCAQCHDHKYDDISQQEFYELYAFLDAADEINIDAPLRDEREAYETALPEYHRKRRELIAPLASEIDELQRRWEAKILEARDNPGQDWYWDRQWELVGLVWGGNLGEGQLEGWQIVMLDSAKRSQLQKDRLLDYFLPKADTIDREKAKELKLGELNAELGKLSAELPKVTRAPTMMSTQNPRTTFVHLAGDFRDRGNDVLPVTPRTLPPIENDRRDRLALARWLVAREHPLTSRVAVNRMWQHFFGRGIVTTVGDFGVRGAPPTHPELLDWLADEFIRRDWDGKAMHRLIVSSAAYRQSSHLAPRDEPQGAEARIANAAATETTAEGGSSIRERRLLSSQTPLRLSAEQIRDSVLVASGLWDSRLSGPSVRPPQPDSVSEQGYGNKWETSEGGDRYRRAVYTWVQRTSPFAMHITFDAPNPNHICTQRDRSNTPLQALTLLNDPVFHEAAVALADRVRNEIDGNDQLRLAHAFRLCLARNPKPDELAVLRNLLHKLRLDPDLSTQETASESNDASSADDIAWTTLCSVLFNLHEFVTRN
ncbi:MAG: DUF1553 domain-containing protein [Planctomycetes bacterium]|nr:DUF1553 domain-containing protein [Planctomycetota bacterium]